MSTSRIATRDMTAAAFCTAIIAVCSQITIPMPGGVPVTLQTFAVALCGFLLAPKLAAASVIVYLLLGAIGVPVFSGFSGGAASLFGLTGGFLWGFLALAVLSALVKRGKKLLPLGLSLIGLVILHLAGVFQYMLLSHKGFLEAALLVSVPFLLKDAVSVILALLLALRLRPLLHLLEK